MKKFEIEHIKFSAEDDEKAVAFLTDGGGRVILELGKLPDVLPLADGLSHHLQLHIALKSDDPEKNAKYLVSMGEVYRKMPHHEAGGESDSIERPRGQHLAAGKKKRGWMIVAWASELKS